MLQCYAHTCPDEDAEYQKEMEHVMLVGRLSYLFSWRHLLRFSKFPFCCLMAWSPGLIASEEVIAG